MSGGERLPTGAELYPVRSLAGGVWRKAEAVLVREVFLEVLLDGRKLTTIACAGLRVEELAVGWLRSEGIIRTSREIAAVTAAREGWSVDVRTVAGRSAAGPRGEPEPLPPPGADGATLSPERIFGLMGQMAEAAEIHRRSRGTHGAALADATGIVTVREDIGRHNCLDMLGGYALLNDIAGGDKAILRTGRVSSDIVIKIWRMGVPVAISLSVPTALAVRMAVRAGITLVGGVRAPSLTVYTHPERVGGA
ncbi:MAG: formate dehydrogenase accessory sulfurtransferase FdhD [Pseudomonadota bacterium]|nr:formate dehydrogenase accessory sulfurtransferase FdhD [Pseudomonadota bacterium]